jgi:hypothetical protein
MLRIKSVKLKIKLKAKVKILVLKLKSLLLIRYLQGSSLKKAIFLGIWTRKQEGREVNKYVPKIN